MKIFQWVVYRVTVNNHMGLLLKWSKTVHHTNFSCLSRFALYIVHTVEFVSCVSLKKVDDDDEVDVPLS